MRLNALEDLVPTFKHPAGTPVATSSVARLDNAIWRARTRAEELAAFRAYRVLCRAQAEREATVMQELQRRESRRARAVDMQRPGNKETSARSSADHRDMAPEVAATSIQRLYRGSRGRTEAATVCARGGLVRHESVWQGEPSVWDGTAGYDEPDLSTIHVVGQSASQQPGWFRLPPGWWECASTTPSSSVSTARNEMDLLDNDRYISRADTSPAFGCRMAMLRSQRKY